MTASCRSGSCILFCWLDRPQMIGFVFLVMCPDTQAIQFDFLLELGKRRLSGIVSPEGLDGMETQSQEAAPEARVLQIDSVVEACQQLLIGLTIPVEEFPVPVKLLFLLPWIRTPTGECHHPQARHLTDFLLLCNPPERKCCNDALD